MSAFLRHEGCARCGSSDALAVYKGGSSYCFSCHWYTASGGNGGLASIRGTSIDREDRQLILPNGINTHYPIEVIEWTMRGGVGPSTLMENGVVWCPSTKQLIFPFYEHEKLVLYQARNFGNTKLKYFTQGAKEECIPFYSQFIITASLQEVCERTVEKHPDSVCCIVEDCLSAIRTCKQGLSIPCLGSTLSKEKIAHLAAVLSPFTRVVVWLDANMYDKAQTIAQRFQLLGLDAMVLWTKDDPKVYTDEEITNYLKEA